MRLLLALVMAMGVLAIGASALVLAMGASAPAFAGGDAARGALIYEGCQDCHSFDKNEVGPRHRGVYGRAAGSLADYPYSPALKNAGFVWDEKTLDQWLADPEKMRPGVKMYYHLDAAQDRADVIAYLKTLSP